MTKAHKLYLIIAASATTLAVALALYYLYYLPNKKSMGNKKLSAKGASFIKQKEGIRYVAYREEDLDWTIGYGHTSGVKPGDTCTKAQAEKWFLEDVKIAEDAVNKEDLNISQNQFDALVSYAYNIGIYAFASSNLLKLIKCGASESVIKKWWTTHWIMDAGVVKKGLITRRTEEANMFFA